MSKVSGYELSRNFWDWSFANPEKVKPIHSAIYFFAIEHCNRLGWKNKFGFPSQMVMEAIGVKNWRTYSAGLSDLVDFGFIKMVEVSKNQYSSNIIAIVNFTKAHTKALDKALQKHSTKHSQSTVSINKQYNKEQLTINDDEKKVVEIFNLYVSELKNGEHSQAIESIYMKLKVKRRSLTPLLLEFKSQLIIDNKVHKNTLEMRKHFNNWLNTQDRFGKLEQYKRKT